MIAKTTSGTARIDRVGMLAAGGMSLVLAILSLRVAQLQLKPDEKLQELMKPRVTTRQELAVRGDLLDRRGRLLAASKFGWRVVVDPTLLPESPDEVIVKLAGALHRPANEIGTRIVSALEENAKRGSAHTEDGTHALPRPIAWLKELAEKVHPNGGSKAKSVDAESGEIAETDDPKKPIRYVVLTKGPIDDEVAEQVRALRIATPGFKPRKGREVDPGMPIPGVILERREIREYPGGREIATLVGKVGFDGRGLSGIEGRIDKRLSGTGGQVSFVREADGTPLWMEPGQVQPGSSGESVRLSIDLELQRMFIEELMRGIEDAEAAGGRIIGLDPATGEILAMADIVRRVPDAVPYPWVKAGAPRSVGEHPLSPITGGKRYITIKEDPTIAEQPELARNRCLEDVYEPGSTFKPFVWATITELGLAQSNEIFETGHVGYVPFPGRPPISDVTKRDRMTWDEVLINSSNIGMIKGASRMSFAQLHGTVARFKFGQPTGLLRLAPGAGLGGEASGIITSMKNWSKYTQVSVAFGHEVAVTPVQMVRAFSVFARNGEFSGTMPTLRLLASRPGIDDQGVIYRVLPRPIAEKTRRTMLGVADSMENKLADAHQGTGETGWQYRIFGKSGTAEIPLGKAPKGFRKPHDCSGYFDDQYNSSFIAGGPIESPRLVVLCVIDDPGPNKTRVRKHYGAVVAGPVVRRVMERALTYLGVPPSERKEDLLASETPGAIHGIMDEDASGVASTSR